MAKVNGIGVTVSVDDAANSPTVITNDVTSVSMGNSRATTEVTGLDKSAVERLLLLADFKLGLSGIYNSALSHTVFKTATSSDQVRSVALGLPGPSTLSMEMVIESYNIERGDDGSLKWTAELSLQSGTAPSWS